MGAPNQPPGEDRMALVRCHRARNLHQNRSHGSKKPLDDHKKQLWYSLFYYFCFLNATSFSGIGLIVVIKVWRGNTGGWGML